MGLTATWKQAWTKRKNGQLFSILLNELRKAEPNSRQQSEKKPTAIIHAGSVYEMWIVYTIRVIPSSFFSFTVQQQ